VIGGDAITVDTLDSYIRTDRMLVATLGVRNLVVVEAGDSILIADRERSKRFVGSWVAKTKRPRLCHKV